MSFTSEFRSFISKGNVVDLAVGLVVGAAFAKIIDSLVADVIMPPIGMLIGGVNFTDLKVVLKPETIDAAGKAVSAVAIKYGSLLQAIFNFLIVALAIFTFVVKPINRMRKANEVLPPPPPPTREEILLTEIRDLLRK